MNRRIIRSPKENIAENDVLAVSVAETQIKEVIVKSAQYGLTKEQVSRQVIKIINEQVAKVSLNQQKTIKTSLQISANKWYVGEVKNIRLLSENLIKKLDSLNPVVANQIRSEWAKYEKQNRNEFDKQEKKNKDLSFVFEPKAKSLLETSQDFRGKVDTNHKGLALINDYEKSVREQVKLLATNTNVLAYTTKNGDTRQMSARNYAEMKVRYEANVKQIQQFREDKVDYFWFSSHADCSKRCSFFQGKLATENLELVDKYVEGNKVINANDAFLGKDGDGNGIMVGYGCRHHMIEYSSGSRAPNEYNEEQIKKERAIDQRQRYYENRIRNIKKREILSRAAGDKKTASTLNERWKKSFSEYKKFSFKYNRAFYEWRTQVQVPEKEMLLAQKED